MDWLKLFALLVAVASVQIKADGPKKKIRIHLPQKVKHIHHHKKIYITNHPAPAATQYAPAYLPGSGGVAAGAGAGAGSLGMRLPLTPLGPLAPSASKLVPLYHARGYYGPAPADLDDGYEPVPPPDAPDDYPAPSKKIKIVKLSEPPRKKVLRKGKPRRPRPPPADEELPVTDFHERFYSDIDGSGTIRKIKKPPRVEKIVDGDTEHIHTYSEEHIHKLVFDDPVAGMTALGPARPLKNGQTLIAIPSDSFPNFEYAAYGPRDVTHDHIFHDHGEIPSDVDINEETLGLPPKVSYNSQGLRISGGGHKRQKNKYGQRIKKVNKPHPTDFTYYEGIYASNRPKKTVRQPYHDETSDSNLDEYRMINNVRYKENPRSLIPTYYGKSGQDFRAPQSSASAPFAVSSTIVHDYKPKSYGGASSSQRSKDPFANFKDNYGNNYEYDTYASSSNIYATEDKNDNAYTTQEIKGIKSISTQNINFGGKDHLTYVDHLEDSLSDDNTPTALDNLEQFDQSQSAISPTPTPFTIKESSPVHPYYSVLAVNAMHSNEASMPAASSDHYQYAAPPASTPEPPAVPLATTAAVPRDSHATAAPAKEPDFGTEVRQTKRFRDPNLSSADDPQRRPATKTAEAPNEHRLKSHKPDQSLVDHHNPLTARSKLKYGDKI